jgi:hypothetical protein
VNPPALHAVLGEFDSHRRYQNITGVARGKHESFARNLRWVRVPQPPPEHASMAELVDALGLGPSG